MLDCLLPYDLDYRIIQIKSPLLQVSHFLIVVKFEGNVSLSKILITLRPTLTLWHITVNKLT